MPSQVTFEVQGLKELSQRMQRGDTAMKIALNDGLRKIGRLFVPAKGSGPLALATPKRTGRLRLSTFYQLTGGPGDQVLTILQPARSPEGDFYGGYVRDGTPPHEIRARRGKALRFEAGGDVIFRVKVNHPGTKPNPYHVRVFERLRGSVQGIVNQMGARVVSYLSGKGG